MFGLVILFFLGLWILITIIATVAGARKKGSKGAFIGFMLTMGGPITYWISEYIYIQYTVNQLCKNEGGVTVYVTPEQWRKQIGEEEWDKLSYIGDNVSYSNRKKITFEDTKYISSVRINQKITSYRKYININHISNSNLIYVDDSKNVLFKITAFSVPYGPDSLKFWLRNIKTCPFNKTMLNYDIYEQYSTLNLNK